MNIFSV